MFKRKRLPSKNELVLCTVKRLHPHSAFVTLDEFDNVEGMLHISEVALRGVKHIKDYLSVGKKLVCKVLSINGSEIDVSLKRVNSGERKSKLNESRIEKRFYHLVEHACSEAGLKFKIDEVVSLFVKQFGSLFNAYESLRVKGLSFLKGLSFPSKLVPIFNSSFESLLRQLVVRIKRELIVSSLEGDGVSRIKRLLTGFNVPEGFSVDFSYLGSNRFLLVIEAMNYKLAEDFFESLSAELEGKASDLCVKVSFSD